MKINKTTAVDVEIETWQHTFSKVGHCCIFAGPDQDSRFNERLEYQP